MPANLTPEYLLAEARFKAAREPGERVEALEEMLRVIPKHKGTDHLRGDLRRKLSQLREEARTAPRKGGARRADPGNVPRQGAGQVVLLGPANSGKSSLCAALTRAEPEIAPYPYTTRRPLPAMMMFEDVPIQLVDCPAMEPAVYEPWMNSLTRNADLGLVVVDPSAMGALDAVDVVASLVARGRARLVPAWWAVGQETPAGDAAAAPLAGEELDDEALLARLDPGDAELPILVVANKLDEGENRAAVAALGELLGETWPVLATSAKTGEGLEALGALLFRALRVMRVYAKPPGKPASTKAPIILPVGATVRDMARVIHKDLEERLRFARIWSSRHFDGQRIPRDAELHDRDIVELNA